jgi:hypothetical protein
MFLKLALSVGLLTAVGLAPSYAQTTSDTRSPTAGDPGAKPVPVKPHKPFIRKHAVITDKPVPGATTGNAPARAGAGGGGG